MKTCAMCQHWEQVDLNQVVQGLGTCLFKTAWTETYMRTFQIRTTRPSDSCDEFAAKARQNRDTCDTVPDVIDGPVLSDVPETSGA